MKEIAGIAANYYLVPNTKDRSTGNEFDGFAEFALTLQEAVALCAPGSTHLYHDRKLETVYFGAGVKAIDELIDVLIDARKGLRELEGSDG